MGGMVLQNQLNVDNCDNDRISERIAHTSVAPNELCGGTQLTRGKLRICARNSPTCGAWKCEVRIKAWEARVIQLEALGAARECWLKLVARLKQARTVDDAEDECDAEIVLDASIFPYRTVSPGASRSERETERDVREASCDKRNTVVKEGDTINVLCDTVSSKTVRLRVVRAGLRVVCDVASDSVRSSRFVDLRF